MIPLNACFFEAQQRTLFLNVRHRMRGVRSLWRHPLKQMSCLDVFRSARKVRFVFTLLQLKLRNKKHCSSLFFERILVLLKVLTCSFACTQIEDLQRYTHFRAGFKCVSNNASSAYINKAPGKTVQKTL